MSDKTFAVACKVCGAIETNAWDAETDTTHSKRSERPLSSMRDRLPAYCPKCGARSWEVPASKERLAAYENQQRRQQRALELTAKDDFDGLFKIPDELRASPEIKRALSNLLAPLEGDVLKTAQANLIKVSRSGMQGDALAWIDFYDQAVQKALSSAKTEKPVAR